MKMAASVFNNTTYHLLEQPPPSWMVPMLSDPTHNQATIDDVNANFEAGRDEWQVTEADVDNDGKIDRLVKFKRGSCSAEWPDSERYFVAIMVLDSDGTVVKTRKTRQILRSNTLGVVGGPSSYDLFSYRSNTYVDQWNNKKNDQGERILSVYLNKHNETSLVCRLAFPTNNN